jgi:hypothetical protein
MAGDRPFETLLPEGKTHFEVVMSGNANVYHRGGAIVEGPYFKDLDSQGVYWCREKEDTFAWVYRFDKPSGQILSARLDVGTWVGEFNKANHYEYAALRPVRARQ